MGIPLNKVYMSSNVDESLLEVLHSGWIGQGDKVDEFEYALSQRMENPRCLTLSSGTHGIHLALRLLDIKPGDEVITTPFTCTATNWPILMQGAEIVWADIKEDDLNIDPEDIERKITDKTKAIVIVHWAGYPCDLAEIYDFGIPVIEDAAHAFGATYGNSIIGDCTYSDYTMFSFQAVKHLTTIDGGALFTKYLTDYNRGKRLRWFGINRPDDVLDDIPEWGYKYHMNDISATIGLSNLEEVDDLIAINRDNARFFREALSGIDGITLLEDKDDRESTYWIFPMLVDNRDDFKRNMDASGIMTSVSRLSKRNDEFECVERFKTELPVLDKVVPDVIHIPCGWWVTEKDREYIVSSIRRGW